MSSPAEHAMLEVRLEQFPVQVWGRSREHSDGLQREFALMSIGEQIDGSADDKPVPTRLLELVRNLRAQYADATSAQELLLDAALEQGLDELDELVYVVPADAVQASLEIGMMYDEADDFCREGQHLLTLTTPDELVSFRRWFLGEFVRQAQGQPPTPWPVHLATS